MLYLIMSDTHGSLLKAKEVMGHYPQIDALIHLGDCCKDAAALKNLFSCDLIKVTGNCDYAPENPSEKILEVDGKRIFLTHGHGYDVKSGTGRLEAKALKEKFDAVLFGHTHIPLLRQTAATLLINPGSLGYPRGFSGPTYALLELSGGRLEARILDA